MNGPRSSHSQTPKQTALPFIATMLVVHKEDEDNGIASRSSGIVRGINADGLKIEGFEEHPPSQDETAILAITLKSQRVVNLATKYQPQADLYTPANADASLQLMDLLHILRKEQHIEICATQNVEHSQRVNGFEHITLPHVSLPECSWQELCTKRSLFGSHFAAPFLITGMTGGVDQAAMINHRLASAAERYQIPMGVGSQRIALENEKHADIFTLKKSHPKLFLIGNIGIGQLVKGDALDLCRRAVDMIDADALAIHVNILQELVQIEGDRDFRGLLDRIGHIAEHLGKPVIVKEVGTGMDPVTVQKLYERQVRTVDVGGAGGTSWALIEGLRSKDSRVQRLGQLFRDWGLSTAEALQKAVELKLPEMRFVATGGMRDGITALKALQMGASMVGIGLPLFKAALKSENAPAEELEALLTELKIAMMCSGIKQLS